MAEDCLMARGASINMFGKNAGIDALTPNMVAPDIRSRLCLKGFMGQYHGSGWHQKFRQLKIILFIGAVAKEFCWGVHIP